MAQVDAEGNVNVSRFGPKFAGAGGFINISQNAKSVYFLGTFTAESSVSVKESSLKIVKKFVKQVEQVTFSGVYARQRGQTVYYLTERCVFQLTPAGLELIEVAPGVNLERDILAYMEFRPIIPEPIRLMDERIFREEMMGLREQSVIPLAERTHYDVEQNIMYVNFEGLRLETVEEAQALADYLDRTFAALGKRVKVVVNYDNFELHPSAAATFFEMAKHNKENYFLSSTRYSTNAFFRHQLGQHFAQADLAQRIYRSFDEAREGLT